MDMKINKLIIGLFVVVVILLVFCEKFGVDVEILFVSIFVFFENLKVGEEVMVMINIDVQYLIFFMGDEGKNFECLCIKVIMEYDWDSFYEECYWVFYVKNGEKILFYKYFKDYQSIEDVKKDFEFFGVIDNIQLVFYKKGDFLEVLMEMSYIGMN